MIDAKNGTFQLQARTSPAQGNSQTATIFTAGVAKEENTSTVEVRVKTGGEWLPTVIMNLTVSQFHRSLKLETIMACPVCK